MSRNVNLTGFGVVRQPQTILFGPGERRSIAGAVAAIGNRALIVTDRRMEQSAEFAEILESLAERGADVSVYADVEAELPRTNVEDLLARQDGRTFDVVVAVGGGSCLDMAKVAAVMLTHGGSVSDYYGEFKVPGPTVPIVAVPTTGGTGAESTCISVVYDPDLKMKVGIASPYLEATVAVVDPVFTLTCPPSLTAATGADALSHLVEAFTARSKNPEPGTQDRYVYVGKNVLTDEHCRVGIRLLGTSLERVMAAPDDLEARSDTMRAALHAGLAINTTGTAGAHALQSPIGALTHTPHGFGVGTLLPYVMRFNLPERVPEFAEIGRLLGVADATADDIDQAHAGIERIDEILLAIGVPGDLAELGLDADAIPEVAAQAMLATRLTANNPRPLTEESMRLILDKAFKGDRSWWS
ncbi:iron-containing alcohol dehydrogenase [Nonomuraea aridisoli]|uniref:Alcohol dehydrogenase n=1 Tax=Nonomuraea aridisoli TaxID=2070368 RepID=A0A2W2ES73_9ACTN|nr:iron-containing alcohol dehydrogenase [Nonomuraea aridisoli]PZG19315.1 alcohol dehydrogenase [Nonomuraea aridisoli]